MKWPSKRLETSLKKSFGMYEQAINLESKGIELIHLGFGRPYADTPLHIKEATKKALDDGIVHYGDFRGTEHLREGLADKLRNFNKLECSADEILVTNGLTHASFIAFMAAIDPGDEVILLEPYYPQHTSKIEMAGGKVVKAKLDTDDNFSIKRHLIEEKITTKTRMIVIVNPANPTGRIYSRSELQIVADLALKHDLLVLSDEVYEYITYDQGQHISIAVLPGMKSRTISCHAFTKAYAMDGWRIGYMVADSTFISALLSVVMNDVTHVNVFVQEGAYAAVTGPQQPLYDMVAQDDEKRRIMVEALNKMSNVSCQWPEAAIYAFPNIKATGMKSDDLAVKILNETHVVVESGNFYGEAGEGHLRICFGSESVDQIREAMKRLTVFFQNI